MKKVRAYIIAFAAVFSLLLATLAGPAGAGLCLHFDGKPEAVQTSEAPPCHGDDAAAPADTTAKHGGMDCCGAFCTCAGGLCQTAPFALGAKDAGTLTLRDHAFETSLAARMISAVPELATPPPRA